MKNVLVIAPHPDDESLGCGGTLLKHHDRGDRISWLIVTEMSAAAGFAQVQIERRTAEISRVADFYGFDSVNKLGLTPACLDQLPMLEIISLFSSVIDQIKPEIIYIPFRGDVHTDHRTVFDAVSSCSKSFRYPFIKKIACYETISETDFCIAPDTNCFRPNLFVSIDNYFEKKITVLSNYESELGVFPFPRSIEAVKALAMLRGVAAGCQYAEAFMVLREID